MRREPQLIIVGGEPLWPEDETVLKEYFRAHLRQVYQAAEGFFGASCRYGRLHFNSDVMRIEKSQFLCDNRRFVPVVTDLVRSSPQSITRYCTDDIAVEASDACECGSALPSVKAIEGRLADVLILPSGRMLFPGDVHAALAPELSGHPFRVIQEEKDQIALELPSTLSAVASRNITNNLRELSGCHIIKRELIWGGIDEKFRRVIRRVEIEKDYFVRQLQEPISLMASARNSSLGL